MSSWFLGIVITVKPNITSYIQQFQTNDVFGCFALHLECTAFILCFFDQIYLTLLITPIYLFIHFIIQLFIFLQSEQCTIHLFIYLVTIESPFKYGQKHLLLAPNIKPICFILNTAFYFLLTNLRY